MSAKIWMGFILCLAVVLCFGTAPAAEKGPIHFAILTDLTGPAHAQVSPQGWAVEDYIKYSDKKGGINGHPLTVEVIDTKYQLPLVRTAYTRNKDRKHTTMSFDALSGGIEAMKGQFLIDKIPVLMITGHGPAVYPSSWVFGTVPPYDDYLCAYADWIKKTWKEKRNPRLALLLGDYASGRSPEMAKWYVEKIGIDMVCIEYVPLLPTDTSDILIRMRDKKPDFVFDTLMPDQCKVVLRDRFKLGIKIPQANFVYNSDLIKATVPLEAYVDYMGFQSAASWWEKDVPGVKLSYELYKNRGPIPVMTYIAAVGAAMVWVEAVKNALNKVGYEKVDGQEIYNGYMQIKNFDAMGIFKNIAYSPDDLRGNKWVKLCIFNKDGSISPLTDYYEAPHNLKLKAKEGK
jgi:ABC-type branched-subunit amino acid transport system substrate-binding protein